MSDLERYPSSTAHTEAYRIILLPISVVLFHSLPKDYKKPKESQIINLGWIFLIKAKGISFNVFGNFINLSTRYLSSTILIPWFPTLQNDKICIHRLSFLFFITNSVLKWEGTEGSYFALLYRIFEIIWIPFYKRLKLTLKTSKKRDDSNFFWKGSKTK